MNRAEYLNQLNKYLKKLPKSDYENAMEYFTEYFEEVGEKQAIEELGTPKEAAAEILDNLFKSEFKRRAGKGRRGINMKRFMKILGIAGIAFCLCGFAMIGIGYAFGGRDYMRAENLADIKNVFFRNAERDPEEIGNIKIDTGEVKVDIGDIKVGSKQKDSAGHTKEESTEAGSGIDSDDVHTWKLDDVKLGSVSSIKADLDCIDFDIAVSEDKDFHLSYELQCMNRTNPLSYDLKNGILTLKETNFKGPSWRKSFWNMGSTASNYYSFITLYVPSDIVLKSCILNIGDCDLTVKGLHCNTMETETTDGDMSIKESSFEKTVIKTEGGDIVFSDTSISGDLQLNTADGDISATDLNVKGTVQLDTEDGDVCFSGGKVSGGIKINAEDGDIAVSDFTASEAVELIASDGDVAISDFTESNGVCIQTDYGDISASALDITGKLQIDTEDGDVLLSSLGVSGKVTINTECGDIFVKLQKKSLPNLKIAMDTEDGELSVARSLGGSKSHGHYERKGSSNIYLKGYTEEGDISIQ